jgi:hypothetical protein
MEQSHEITTHEMDKTAIDASPLGITVSVHSSARCGNFRPDVVADSLSRLFQRVRNEHAIDLSPLRLVQVTARLGEAVSHWERAIGLPESGLSNQPEGVVAGKHMRWGNDKESARSIIILADYIAGGVAMDIPVAIATVVHELGHVNDELARGLILGFPQSQLPPNISDWPGLCACVAENTWGEYAAESVAAGYWGREDMHSLMLNDLVHLEGVHKRLQQSVWSFKLGQRDLTSLWSAAVTDVYDIFANLGRATARLPFAGSDEEALARRIDPDGEAACWKPVIERLVHELQALGVKNYSEWGAEPLSALKEVIALGFEAAGFFPTYDGKNLHVKVS